MPGKVNPVIPEAVAMVAAQVIGNDLTIAIAGQSGNFQLNVMLPLVAYNLLQSASLLGGRLPGACRQGHRRLQGQPGEARRGARPQSDSGDGDESGDRLRKGRRHRQEGLCARAGRSAKSAREMTDLTDAELDRLLDAMELTRGGIKG